MRPLARRWRWRELTHSCRRGHDLLLVLQAHISGLALGPPLCLWLPHALSTMSAHPSQQSTLPPRCLQLKVECKPWKIELPTRKLEVRVTGSLLPAFGGLCALACWGAWNRSWGGVLFVRGHPSVCRSLPP